MELAVNELADNNAQFARRIDAPAQGGNLGTRLGNSLGNVESCQERDKIVSFAKKVLAGTTSWRKLTAPQRPRQIKKAHRGG